MRRRAPLGELRGVALRARGRAGVRRAVLGVPHLGRVLNLLGRVDRQQILVLDRLRVLLEQLQRGVLLGRLLARRGQVLLLERHELVLQVEAGGRLEQPHHPDRLALVADLHDLRAAVVGRCGVGRRLRVVGLTQHQLELRERRRDQLGLGELADVHEHAELWPGGVAVDLREGVADRGRDGHVALGVAREVELLVNRRDLVRRTRTDDADHGERRAGRLRHDLEGLDHRPVLGVAAGEELAEAVGLRDLAAGGTLDAEKVGGQYQRRLTGVVQRVAGEQLEELRGEVVLAEADGDVAHLREGLHGGAVLEQVLLVDALFRGDVAEVEADDRPALGPQRLDEVRPTFEAALLRRGTAARRDVAVGLAGHHEREVRGLVGGPRREQRQAADGRDLRRGRRLVRRVADGEQI